jgi:hypothetical protein
LRRHPIQFIDVDADNFRSASYIDRAFKHTFFSWAGLRSIIAEHTVAEHNALQKYSRECFQVVEIGVAEGASAIALRDGMNPRGNL